jgi:hypothetical protein
MKYIISKIPNQINSGLEKCIMLKNLTQYYSLLEIVKMVLGRNDLMFMNGKLIKNIDPVQKIIHFDGGAIKSF